MASSQQQSTLPYNYSRGQIIDNNAMISRVPVWCSSNVPTAPSATLLSPLHESTLQKLMDQHYAARTASMEQLLLFKPNDDEGELFNVDFLSDFYSLMYIDATCLCQRWIDQHSDDYSFAVLKEPFAAGKVGVAYLVVPSEQVRVRTTPQRSPSLVSFLDASSSSSVVTPSARQLRHMGESMLDSIVEIPTDTTPDPPLNVVTSSRASATDTAVAPTHNKNNNTDSQRTDHTGLAAASPMALVLKGIRDVEIKTYLTLRVMEYTDEIGQVNEGALVNRFPSAQRPGAHVLLAVGGDNFANQTCIHLILNTILSNIVPNYVYQYDAFICSSSNNNNNTKSTASASLTESSSSLSSQRADDNRTTDADLNTPVSIGTGYSVLELATEGDLSDYLTEIDDRITDEVMLDMLAQILLPLRILKQPLYGFVHGDMKTKNVFVSSRSTADNDADDSRRQRLAALSSSSSYVFKIADFDKSSIYWHGARFYNYTWDVARLFDRPPVQVGETKSGIRYYQFGGRLIDRLQFLQPYIMFNPLGFYTSYDIYTLFISLMLEGPFYRYVRTYPTSLAAQAWKWLWFDGQDYDKIMVRIEVEHARLRDATNIEERKAVQKEMRRIVFVNHILVANALKLRINVDEIYNLFGVSIPPALMASNMVDASFFDRPITVSSDNHLCTTPCRRQGGSFFQWCRTNRYSRRTLPGITVPVVYDWDYCKK